MKNKTKVFIEGMEAWAAGLMGIQSLDFCGCGNPSEGYDALLETLKAYHTDGDRKKWAEARGGNWSGPGNGYDYMILYFLNAHDLMEHGGSVGGSWLTQKGQSVLRFLEEWGTDPDEWPSMTDFEKSDV